MPILTSNPSLVGAGSDGTEGHLRRDSGWQKLMKDSIRTVDQLCDVLSLPAEFKANVEAVRQFPVFVPPPFLSRIQPGDPTDPLLLQVLPVVDEDNSPDGYRYDPLGESVSTVRPGMLHKYQGRVLLVTTGACAIHCRYCFRRHFPYEQSLSAVEHWMGAFEQIANDSTIEEVLLSGGDPLTLVDSKIEQLVGALEQIIHLKRIRVHTRLPIVIPQRVTDRLIEIFRRSPLQPIFVVHVNHANEIDEQVVSALDRLVGAGFMVLNQSVLLRGVNDNEAALTSLSRRLIDCRVTPYYLHQLDPVRGASHFEVPIERGKALILAMRNTLPGYAVPRYVQEIPGQPSKTVLA